MVAIYQSANSAQFLSNISPSFLQQQRQRSWKMSMILYNTFVPTAAGAATALTGCCTIWIAKWLAGYHLSIWRCRFFFLLFLLFSTFLPFPFLLFFFFSLHIPTVCYKVNAHTLTAAVMTKSLWTLKLSCSFFLTLPFSLEALALGACTVEWMNKWHQYSTSGH